MFVKLISGYILPDEDALESLELFPVWKQPTGAQDSYMTGDKVHYPTKDNRVYESTMDYNTYAPDTYEWRSI